MRSLRTLLASEGGATTIEYAVAVCVVAVMIFYVGEPFKTPITMIWNRLLAVFAVI